MITENLDAVSNTSEATSNLSGKDKKVSAILAYVIDSPWKASFTYFLKPSITYTEKTRLDQAVINLMVRLCLLGQEDFVKGLRDKNTQAINAKAILDELFEKFSDMVKNGLAIEEQKKLKKLIHDYAEQIGYNTKLANKKRIINPNKGKENNKNYYKNYYVDTCEVSATSKDIKKRENRKKKKAKLNMVSFAVSMIVGLGEGLVAAVFASSMFAFIPALLLIGIPAGICNYCLFRNDSYSVFKKLFLSKNTDSKNVKTAKYVGTFFSATAGISIGFLSFGSASIAFGHLLFGLTAVAAMAAPPVGLIVISAVIAVVTAVALTTLYTYAVHGLIEKCNSENYKKMKKSFFDFFRPKKENGESKSFSELSTKQKIAHVFGKTIEVIFKIAFVSIAFAMAALVCIATSKIFNSKADQIFQGAFKVAATASKIASAAIVYGMGALVNSIFYIKSSVNAVNLVKKVFTGAAKAFVSPRETMHKISEKCSNLFRNPYSIMQSLTTGFKRTLLAVCVVQNSVIGQGMGMGSSVGAQHVVEHATHLSAGATDIGISTAGSLGSGGANTLAVIDVTKPVPRLKIDATNTVSPSEKTEKNSDTDIINPEGKNGSTNLSGNVAAFFSHPIKKDVIVDASQTSQNDDSSSDNFAPQDINNAAQIKTGCIS